MARTLTASDRKRLIRLASTLPAGSPERKAILAGLSKSANMTDSDVRDILKKNVSDAIEGLVGSAYDVEIRLVRASQNADASVLMETEIPLLYLPMTDITIRNPKAQKAVDDATNAAVTWAFSTWKKDYATFISEYEIPVEHPNLTEYLFSRGGRGSGRRWRDAAEELVGYETDAKMDVGISFRLGAFYFAPRTIRVVALVGQFGKRIGTFSTEFTFTDEADLVSKLKKSLSAAAKSY